MNSVGGTSRYHYDLGFQDGYMACKKDYKNRVKETI